MSHHRRRRLSPPHRRAYAGRVASSSTRGDPRRRRHLIRIDEEKPGADNSQVWLPVPASLFVLGSGELPRWRRPLSGR
jgi:hypothetical protein